jgi:hypothetical protein
MDKRKRVPDVLSMDLFRAVVLCVTLLAGPGIGLTETSRPLVAQQPAPQRQPQVPMPQPPAPATAAQGVPASPATTPGTQPPGSPGAPPAAPAGGQGAPAIGGQAVAPVPAASTPLGVVREKETKETKETRETKDHPSDLVGAISALAWPVAIVALVIFVLISVMLSRTIQRVFRIAVSVVQRIEIAGVKLDIDPTAVSEVKDFLGESLARLMRRAKTQYDQAARVVLVQELLRRVVDEGLQQILAQHGLAPWPASLRATVHVPDVVFKDYMYQLVDYYPNASRKKTAGRRLSQRFGVIGRAWRLQKSIGRGRAISGSDASNQLIMYWGMQPGEAKGETHPQPANLCVILIDAQANDTRVGLLYIDSTAPDAFGINPPSTPAPTSSEAAAAAAQTVAAAAAVAVAQAVAQATAGAAAQQAAARRAAQAAAEAVARAAAGATTQAADNAAAQAAADPLIQQAANDLARDAARLAAENAANTVAQAAAAAAAAQTAAAQAVAGAAQAAAAQAAAAVAQAAANAVQQAAADAAAHAAAAVGVQGITADQIAVELQDHLRTRDLAHAIGQAMTALRSGGPELDITDLRNEPEQA